MTSLEQKKPDPAPSWPVSRFSALVAAMGLLIAAWLPPDGLGFTLCWFHHLTGLPCPGCGLMRSMASLFRLDPARAMHYHPLGPLVFVVLVSIAGVALLPLAWRRPLAAWAEKRRKRVLGFYWTGVAVFLVFGFIRMAIIAGERCGFLAQR